MKLKEWAEKQGIAYLTAWRWFKAGDPRLANAYQSDSGTIIVAEDSNPVEPSMNNVQDSDIMAVVLKKTVEFSKNDYAIEDFTAWLLSNFTLKIKGIADVPKYSKVKPKPEEIQKHFQQFFKPKGEKPKPNVYLIPDGEVDNLIAESDDLAVQELLKEIDNVGTLEGISVNSSDTPEVKDLMKEISCAIGTTASKPVSSQVTIYDNITDGVVKRSVDLTSQPLNYTSSVSSTLSDMSPASCNIILNDCTIDSTFRPTQKELDSVKKVSAIDARPRRGRKSSKPQGNK